MLNRMDKVLRAWCGALVAMLWMSVSTAVEAAAPDVPSTQHAMEFEDDPGEAFFRTQGTSRGDVLGDGSEVTVFGYPDGHPLAGCLGGCVLARTTVWTEIEGVMIPDRVTVRLLDAPQQDEEFGAAVASGGDLNGDGHDDILVGAPGAFGSKGRVYVYCGSTSNLLYAVEGEAIGDRFGASVAVIGDVTGDGVADFMVGAPHYSGAAHHAGRVYVYSGATGDLLLTVTGQDANGRFGAAVTGGRSELPPGVRPLHTIGPQWTIIVGVDPAQGAAERKTLLFNFDFPFDPAATPAPGPQGGAAAPAHCDEASFLIAMQEAIDDLAQAGDIDLDVISAQTFGDAVDAWRIAKQISCPEGPASIGDTCWQVQIGTCRFSWCELRQSIDGWRDEQLDPLDQLMRQHRNRLTERRRRCNQDFSDAEQTAEDEFWACLQINQHEPGHGLGCRIAMDQQLEDARVARDACLAAANNQFFIESSPDRLAIDDVWDEYYERIRNADSLYLRCLLGFPGTGFDADQPLPPPNP